MAIDPNEIATEQTQRAEMNAAGAPTEFAKGPGQEFEVAGLGKLLDLFAKQVTSSRIPKIDPDAALPPAGVGQRVPTPVEEAAALNKGTKSYQQIQRANMPNVLSPPGQIEFQDRGFQAFPDDRQFVLDEADEALRKEAEEQALEANKLAQQGLTAEKRGFVTSGLAPEAKADAIIDRIKKHEMEIKSLVEGGDFNFDYIEGNQDLFKALTAVSEEYSDETVARTRGKISNEQTIEDAAMILADEIGFSRRLLKRKIGEGGLTAAEFVAGRELLVRSATKLIEAAELIKKGEGTEALRLRFRRQLAIHAGIQLQLKGAQTEVARALQSFKITVGGEETAKAADLAVQRLLQQGGGSEVTDELASRLLEVAAKNGPAGINRFALKGYLAKTKNVIHEAYLVGLLSNPATQIKNILGTATFMLYQVPSEVMAAAYGGASRYGRRALGFQIPDDQVEAADALLRVKGWMDSYKDAWTAAGEAFRTELPGQKPSKLDLEQYAAISADPNSVHGRAINELGKRLRIPFRLLLGADEFFKVMASRGELYTRVNGRYNQMLREGKSEQEALDEAGMLLLDPRAIGDEIDARAMYETMQTRIPGLDKVTSAIQSTWLGRFVLPFATAPTNSMLKLIEFSPAGAANSLRRRAYGKITARQHQQEMGRAMLGSGTMLMFSQYAVEGRITGGYPKDKDAREALPPGWQPYSIVLKGKDWPKDPNGEDLPLYNFYGKPNGPLIYVNYSAVEPLGAIMGISADYAQKSSELSVDAGFFNHAAAGLAVTLDYYKELPMLQGVSDMVKILEDGRVDLLTKSIAEPSSLIGIPSPLSSLQRAFADLIDPTRTRPRSDLEYYPLDHALARGPDGQFLNGIVTGINPQTNEPYDLEVDPDLLAQVGVAKNSALDKALAAVSTDMRALRSKDSILGNEREYNAPLYDTLGNVIKSSELSMANRPIASMRNRLLALRIEEGQVIEEGSVEDELMRLQYFTGKWPLTHMTDKSTISYDGASVKIGFGVQSDYTNYVKNVFTMNEPGVGTLDFKGHLNALINSSLYQQQPDGNRVSLIEGLERRFYKNAVQSFLLDVDETGKPAHTSQAPQILQAIQDKIAAQSYAR